MFADFQSALDIFVLSVPFGFLACILPSFISWGVWYAIDIFKSAARD